MIHHAASFRELVDFRFADGINAACWSRHLPGDYAEVVKLLGPGDGIVALDEDRLLALPASPFAKAAIDTMLADLHLLREAGRDPVLNIVYGYPKDDDPIIPTDVFSWHVDSASIESDTWLCTYHGAPSEGLLTEHALRKVDDHIIRAQLLALFGGKEGDSFTEWLAENHYDLHYAPRPGATSYSFGQFNLWKIACENTCLPRHSSKATAGAWPDAPVPPCVHRAPVSNGPRLLLIS